MNNMVVNVPARAQDGYAVYQANYARRKAGVSPRGYRMPDEVNFGPAAILDLSADANDLIVFLQERKAS